MLTKKPTWIRWIVRLNYVIGGLAIVAMLLHIIIDVAARHLFSFAVQGTLEIVSYYYMVGLIYLAIPVVQARSEHIYVDLFTSSLSQRRRNFMDGIILLFSAALLGLFAWVTAEEALHQTSIRAVVEAGTDTIMVWPSRWLLPLSLGSTMLICLWQSWQILTHLDHNNDHAVGGDAHV